MKRSYVVGWLVGLAACAASAHAYAGVSCDATTTYSTGHEIAFKKCTFTATGCTSGQCVLPSYNETIGAPGDGFTVAAPMIRRWQVAYDTGVQLFTTVRPSFTGGVWNSSTSQLAYGVLFAAAGTSGPTFGVTLDYVLVAAKSPATISTFTVGNCSSPSTPTCGFANLIPGVAPFGTNFAFGLIDADLHSNTGVSPKTLDFNISPTIVAPDVTFNGSCTVDGSPSTAGVGCSALVAAIAFPSASAYSSPVTSSFSSLSNDLMSPASAVTPTLTGGFVALNRWNLSFVTTSHRIWKMQGGYTNEMLSPGSLNYTEWASFADVFPNTATDPYNTAHSGYVFGMK